MDRVLNRPFLKLEVKKIKCFCCNSSCQKSSKESPLNDIAAVESKSLRSFCCCLFPWFSKK